jgi:hypothetical protein
MGGTSPDKAIISDIEKLVDEAIDVYFLGGEIKQYYIDKSLNIRIRLHGDRWDGYADYVIANFILKLQRELFYIYNEAYDESITFRSSPDKLKNLRVKVKLEEGSSFIEIDWNRLIEGLLSNMDSAHIFWVIVILITAATATFSLKHILDYKRKIQERVQNNDLVKSALQTADKAVSGFNREMQSMRYLIKQMHKNDVLEYPDERRHITKREAASTLPSRQTDMVLERTIWVDDRFQITVWNFKEWSFRIKKGDTEFIASLETLRDEDKSTVNNKIEAAYLEGKIPEADLQTIIIFADGEIYKASVIGIGPKRPEAHSFSEALELSLEP